MHWWVSGWKNETFTLVDICFTFWTGEVDICLAWWDGRLAGVGILGAWRSSARMSGVDGIGLMGLIGLMSC